MPTTCSRCASTAATATGRPFGKRSPKPARRQTRTDQPHHENPPPDRITLDRTRERPDDVHNPAVIWYSFHNRDGLVRRRVRFSRIWAVVADCRIMAEKSGAVTTVGGDGGLRAAVRLPGMRRVFPPCHPDRAWLPHHVGRSASDRPEVREDQRKIGRARAAAT